VGGQLIRSTAWRPGRIHCRTWLSIGCRDCSLADCRHRLRGLL